MEMGTDFQRAMMIAGGTLVLGAVFIALSTSYIPGFALILGALLILATGLYFCARALRISPKRFKSKQPDSMPTHELFYDITSRIHELLKSPWMQHGRPASAKGRLRAAVRSWHEDMLSDIPVFNPELNAKGFPAFLKEADEVLQCIETMDIKGIDDEDLLEAAEHQVIDILERLTVFAPYD